MAKPTEEKGLDAGGYCPDPPAARELLSKEDAIDYLAEHLNWKQQHLDPSFDGQWHLYTERDREFFRTCVEWVLAQRNAVKIAMGEGLNDDDRR